jgi:hypothetical protein
MLLELVEYIFMSIQTVPNDPLHSRQAAESYRTLPEGPFHFLLWFPNIPASGPKFKRGPPIPTGADVMPS